MKEYATELFDLLANGAHIYFCGLKGMMPGMRRRYHFAQKSENCCEGIDGMLREVATSQGLDYDEWLKGLKERGTWHVEVY